MGNAAGATRQLLLFSATLPPWVKKIAKEYAQGAATLKEIDLVGDGGKNARDGLGNIAQASEDVKHMCVPVTSWAMNHKVINDVVGAYGGGGQTIVFCETKAECNDVIESKDLTFDRRALHGDIPQALREKTMAAFRNKQFRVLVATDVAARGLDCVVDLVVMNKPPATRSGWADTETYARPRRNLSAVVSPKNIHAAAFAEGLRTEERVAPACRAGDLHGNTTQVRAPVGPHGPRGPERHVRHALPDQTPRHAPRDRARHAQHV